MPSYDLKPEMSADEVADRVVRTRSATATRSASSTSRTPTWSGTRASSRRSSRRVETADRCLGRVVERVAELGGVCLITADHGNAEQMLEDDGVSPHTAHTTNPVPLIVTAPGEQPASGGEIADLAPTALDLLGLEQPPEMTGRSLVNRT